MKEFIKRHRLPILLLCFSIAGLIYFFSFESADNITNSTIGSNSQREELQRYFGYEALAYRYLSLPYDVSMNINQKGEFVEIGFLLLLILPVLLMILVKNRMEKWIIAGSFSLIMIICLVNSNIIASDYMEIFSTEQDINSALASSSYWNTPFTAFLLTIYSMAHVVFGWFEPILGAVAQNADHYTYPILYFSFLLISYIIVKHLEKKKDFLKWIVVLALPMGFFWMILSAGVVWYGYFLFLLGFLIIIYIGQKYLSANDYLKQKLAYGVLGFCGLWIISGYAARVSYIQPDMPQEHYGKNIVNPVVYKYALGQAGNEKQFLDNMYPGINRAIEAMNRNDNEKIFKIGTSFTYFIQNNHKRVIHDNQLGIFETIYQRFKDQLTINDVLKASNIRYIIVDLKTATIDNTPEKSLTEKFRNLSRYIFQNPDLNLLATDRMVKVPIGNGQFRIEYGMVGEVTSPGFYAIYEVN